MIHKALLAIVKYALSPLHDHMPALWVLGNLFTLYVGLPNAPQSDCYHLQSSLLSSPESQWKISRVDCKLPPPTEMAGLWELTESTAYQMEFPLSARLWKHCSEPEVLIPFLQPGRDAPFRAQWIARPLCWAAEMELRS